jgi:hypothetical protein
MAVAELRLTWPYDQVDVDDHERHVEDPGLSGCGAPPRPPRERAMGPRIEGPVQPGKVGGQVFLEVSISRK